MDSNISPNNTFWTKLCTVTTFDGGNDSRTTVKLNNNSDTQSNRKLVAPASFSTSLLIESLIQQLCNIFETNKVRRRKLFLAICDRLHELKLIGSSYNMIEFETLRSQYQHVLYQLVAVARASTGSEELLQNPRFLFTDWSRYHREFQEISFIAAGGFGTVYKALHRLDGIEYAVKKIVVRSGRMKSIIQHLEEVKMLAKLNHTNIISYKGAWIEPILPSGYISTVPQVDFIVNSNNSRLDSNQDIFNHSESTFDNSLQLSGHNTNDKSNLVIVNQNASRSNIEQKQLSSGDDQEVHSDSVSFRNDSKKSKISNLHLDNSTNYTDSSDSFSDMDDNKQICNYTSQMNQGYATLYIQMGLCEKTLHQWLEERIEPTPQVMISKILCQIISGLNYIHSHNIVHHDIKPSNIFIATSGQLQVQLGDFGLACPLQRENHRSIMGTHMYAAPEQLEGKCDPKSDIYSVGIVLLELLIPTNTHMERCQIIKDLKCGQLPATLSTDYPKLMQLVNQLVQLDPKQRPSTHELLLSINDDKDMLITQLENRLVEKDNVIEILQEKVSRLGEQLLSVNNDKSTMVAQLENRLVEKDHVIEMLQQRVLKLEQQLNSRKNSSLMPNTQNG